MVKFLEDGSLLRVSSSTRDAIKSTLRLKEVRISEGEPIPSDKQQWTNVTSKDIDTSFVDEGSNHVLWLDKIDSLSVLNTDTMESWEVPDFWRYKSAYY